MTDKRYKRSRQRERILELLRSTDTHPTACWIYDRLKGEFIDLSMGTVYRNLNILMEQGLVNKIDFGRSFARFDADVSPHYHFICEECSRVLDLKIPVEKDLDRKVAEENNFYVKRHRIEFYGICDRCSLP